MSGGGDTFANPIGRIRHGSVRPLLEFLGAIRKGSSFIEMHLAGIPKLNEAREQAIASLQSSDLPEEERNSRIAALRKKIQESKNILNHFKI